MEGKIEGVGCQQFEIRSAFRPANAGCRSPLTITAKDFTSKWSKTGREQDFRIIRDLMRLFDFSPGAGLNRVWTVGIWKVSKDGEHWRTDSLIPMLFANAKVRDQLLASAGLVYDGTTGRYCIFPGVTIGFPEAQEVLKHLQPNLDRPETLHF